MVKLLLQNPGDLGYDIVLLLGQSNMQGDSGGSISPVLDIVNGRIWSFGATGTYAGQIAQASDPLAHRGSGVGSNSTIVGPGMEFARWYLGIVPENRRVLLVPAAYDGTAILAGTPRWDPTTSWPNDSTNLYNLALTQALLALAAAGSNSRIVAALWVQGESDAINSISGTNYRTALESLIDGLRDRLSLPNLPFVLGSMTPEFIANYTGALTRADIQAVHSAVPTRKAFTAFVQGPAGLGRGDNLHYSPAGHRVQGRQLVGGYLAAQANSAPANAVAANPPTRPVIPILNTSAPTVSGNAVVGQTIIASTGSWSPAPDTFGYQWTRASSAISGATSATYTLVSSDNTQPIVCIVTASKTGYNSASASTPAVTPGVLTNTAAPAISGSTAIGSTLVSSTGTWSPLPDSFNYQWNRAGAPISGATMSSYVLVSADNGQAITCTVTAVKSGYTSVSIPTALVSGGTSVTDSFDRADNSSSLGSTSTGSKTWTAYRGVWGTASNLAYQPGSVAAAVAAFSMGSADHYAQATLTTLDTGTCVLIRVGDGNNWVGLLVGKASNGTITVALYRAVNGTVSQITLASGTVAAFTTGDVANISMKGSVGTISRNGASVATFTDSSTNTGVGMRADTASARFNDFAADQT